MDEIEFAKEEVEEGTEVFENSDPGMVEHEVSQEIDFQNPESEKSVAEYVVEFGQDQLYSNDVAENVQYSDDESEQQSAENGNNQIEKETIYVSVLDEETKTTIQEIKKNTDSIVSQNKDIVEYLSILDYEIQHMEQDINTIGNNHLLTSKVETGCIVALLGAIVMYALFCKIW